MLDAEEGLAELGFAEELRLEEELRAANDLSIADRLIDELDPAESVEELGFEKLLDLLDNRDEAGEVEEWDLAGEAEAEEDPVEGDKAFEKKLDPADAVEGLGVAEEAEERWLGLAEKPEDAEPVEDDEELDFDEDDDGDVYDLLLLSPPVLPP